MSLLAEVLQSADKIDLEEINNKIPEINQTVTKYENNLTDFIDNIYVQFIERPKHNRELVGKLSKLHQEAIDTNDKLNQLIRKGIPEIELQFNNDKIQLEKNMILLKHLNNLLEISESIMIINTLRETKLYLKCMEKIIKTEELISDSMENDDSNIILIKLKNIVSDIKDTIKLKLSNIFVDYVTFEVEDNESIIKIKDANTEFVELFQIFYLYEGSVITLINDLVKVLWDNVFIPIVDHNVKIKIIKENNINILYLSIEDNTFSDYSKIYSNIKLVVEYLKENFCFNVNNNLTTLNFIGMDICDNLIQLLKKNCLEKTIISNEDELKNYNIIIEATENFEKFLQDSQILPNNTHTLLNYVKNIDILYIEKKCEKYMEESEKLMKKDLHDMVEVGSLKTLNVEETSTEFPISSVSKSVVELVKLMKNIYIEGISLFSTDKCRNGKYLIKTIAKIINLYAVLVPDYHKRFLDTIPQQAALFYNNCCFIKFNIFLWNETDVNSLKLNLFINETNQLNKISNELFNKYVNGQIKQINDIMNQSGLGIKSLEKLEPITEKCLRQCLRQQELLKTVWHKVLPYDTYNKTIGTLLNALCNHLINDIINMEDISNYCADGLVDILKLVTTRGPKLFTNPDEISLYVKSWTKLTELIFILNANLLNINDRWADGKGPLALEFKPNELKQLIRALFQNTERRATLLNKIHD